jgi:hypothetical protein
MAATAAAASKEIPMDTPIRPLEPAQPPPIEPAAEGAAKPSGLRRTVLAAAVAGLILVGGGAAIVSAASPEPSAAPSTTESTPTVPDSGTQRSQTGTKANCPDKGGVRRVVRDLAEHDARHHPRHDPVDAGDPGYDAEHGADAAHLIGGTPSLRCSAAASRS